MPLVTHTGNTYRAQIPITQAGFVSRILANIKARTDHIAVVKPERVLGAVWTDDHVQQRKPVTMCEMCWRRYKNWWRKTHYRPDWGWNYRSDCAGCSRKFVLCNLFVAEEKFFTALDRENHGMNPQP